MHFWVYFKIKVILADLTKEASEAILPFSKLCFISSIFYMYCNTNKWDLLSVIIKCWFSEKLQAGRASCDTDEAKTRPTLSIQASSTFQRHFALSNASAEKTHAFSLVSLHRPIFNAHWAVFLNANGQRADASFPGIWCPSRWPVPVPRSSIQSTCHFCQRQDTQKWIPKRSCILTVAATIHRQGEAYLQRAASISFTREKERQPETELETTCPGRSLYSVLTHSLSARV